MRSVEASNHRVFVFGDLNIDHIVTNIELGKICAVDSISERPGGSAVNAAKAFRDCGFSVELVGGIGRDSNGRKLRQFIEAQKIIANLDEHDKLPTGQCNILYINARDDQRIIYYSRENANNYCLNHLRSVLSRSEICSDDYAYVSLHMLDQTNYDIAHCRNYIEIIRSFGLQIIFDIVPHTIYDKISFETLNKIIGGDIYLLISEIRTLSQFLKLPASDVVAPCEKFLRLAESHIDSIWYDFRYGEGFIDKQWLNKTKDFDDRSIGVINSTGFSKLDDGQKVGFGDILTASTLKYILKIE